MKFAEHLSAHITPEWRKQYVSYEELKNRLYYVVEKAPSPESVEPDVLVRYFTTFDEEFFQLCEKELTNINTFFSEKLAEATRKYSNLLAELKSMKIERGKKKTSVRKMSELKLAFSEYYLSLILLQNYQNLNFTGFRKILKKHDKILAVNTGAKWREQNVDNSTFYKSKEIDRLIAETETTVTTELESGDRQKAMKRLRVPPLNEQKSPWTTFKVGLFSGSFIVLFISAVLSAIFHEKENGDLTVALRLYRGPFLLVEFLFLLGINVYGWRSSGVNHVLIFELDPRSHLSEQDLMEIASIFGVVWTLSLLSFLFSASLSIPPYINPLALTITMILFLANPAKVFRHEARFWVLRLLGRIAAAPFFHVGFADFWLADQLNSLVSAFLDVHYLICFYVYSSSWVHPDDTSFCQDNSIIWRPLVNCLPAWFRFAQCLRRYWDTKEAFPHLANAAKYSTTFFVVLFASLHAANRKYYDDDSENPFFYMWVVSSIISSCYTYTWDIKMDWGLFDVYEGDNKFLREEIVYNSTGFYYFAIIEDLILRFVWVVTYLNRKLNFVSNDILSTLLPPLEVFRRFVWNFFRLENEHLNNCGKFRAVRDISVAPLHSSDAATIEKMMDDEDGVTNRRKKKVDSKKIKEDKVQLLKATDSMINLQ